MSDGFTPVRGGPCGDKLSHKGAWRGDFPNIETRASLWASFSFIFFFLLFHSRGIEEWPCSSGGWTRARAHAPRALLSWYSCTMKNSRQLSQSDRRRAHVARIVRVDARWATKCERSGRRLLLVNGLFWWEACVIGFSICTLCVVWESITMVKFFFSEIVAFWRWRDKIYYCCYGLSSTVHSSPGAWAYNDKKKTSM